MTITDSNIDLLYQYHSLTQQVVQTERVDNSNFILKFEDIQNQKKKNKLDGNKKNLFSILLYLSMVVHSSPSLFVSLCF